MTETTSPRRSAPWAYRGTREQALNGLEDKHKQRLAQRRADELGVDAADVTAALDKLAGDGQDGAHGPGGFAQKLADGLGWA